MGLRGGSVGALLGLRGGSVGAPLGLRGGSVGAPWGLRGGSVGTIAIQLWAPARREAALRTIAIYEASWTLASCVIVAASKSALSPTSHLARE